MKVLVIGNGGREHTIIWKLRQDKNIEKIYCAPGNPGISKIAENVNIKVEEIEKLAEFAQNEKIDLTLVGPEGPLVLGIVDTFEARGLKIFGPNKNCAQLEGSKAFSKDFMIRNNIPTAKYREYIDLKDAKENIGNFGYPVVIKADGLAAGKGVVIAANEKEALKALEEMMEDKKFGEAGEKIVIEEFLEGIETSILAFVDGETIVPMVSAKDHKAVWDEDKGPNTGGMGTYSPSKIYDEKLEKEVRENILNPIIEGFKKDNLKYKGILFIGLMITKDGAKVLEFNVRFGDPETQVVLTRLENNLVEIIEAILESKLSDISIHWSENKTACVVLTSKGYPESYEKGKVITGLEKVDTDILLFHSGTRFEGRDIVTNGGRVIGVTAFGKTLKEATEKAYKNIEKIHFEGMHYRKDIGGK